MNRKVLNQNQDKINISKIKHYSILCIILFSFWFLLSGRTEPKLLVLGVLTVLVAAWTTGPLLRLPSTDGEGFFYAFDLPFFRYFAYWAWLIVEIVKANIDILKILINPEMPINPQVISFKKSMRNPMAHVTLGNSITLTPGTVTMDIEGEDTYIIHALNDGFAKGLIPETGEGEMQTKVSKLFGEDWGQRSEDKNYA